jgi:NADH:ubiquinone oxidoreductase subunit E
MVEIRVCIGTSCHLNGSYNVVQGLQQMIEENSLHEKINLEALFCMKQCNKKGVSIKVDSDSYRVLPENVKEFILEHIMNRI